MWSVIVKALSAYAMSVAKRVFDEIVSDAVDAVEQWAENLRKQCGDTVPSTTKKMEAIARIDDAIAGNVIVKKILAPTATLIDSAIESRVRWTK